MGERKALANKTVPRGSAKSSEVIPIEGTHLALTEGRPGGDVVEEAALQQQLEGKPPGLDGNSWHEEGASEPGQLAQHERPATANLGNHAAAHSNEATEMSVSPRQLDGRKVAPEDNFDRGTGLDQELAFKGPGPRPDRVNQDLGLASFVVKLKAGASELF
eukprot:15453461-Alexandrium_andersonii.AAC.1